MDDGKEQIPWPGYTLTCIWTTFICTAMWDNIIETYTAKMNLHIGTTDYSLLVTLWIARPKGFSRWTAKIEQTSWLCRLIWVFAGCTCSKVHFLMLWLIYLTRFQKKKTLSELIQQTTNWWYFSYFSQKTGFDISCKLSPLETICMKCQSCFLSKIRKNISICCLLKILPRVLSLNISSSTAEIVQGLCPKYMYTCML